MDGSHDVLQFLIIERQDEVDIFCHRVAAVCWLGSIARVMVCSWNTLGISRAGIIVICKNPID